jgi:hypothetical protein
MTVITTRNARRIYRKLPLSTRYEFSFRHWLRSQPAEFCARLVGKASMIANGGR